MGSSNSPANPRRSGRLKRQPVQLQEDESIRQAKLNSLKTFEDEQQRHAASVSTVSNVASPIKPQVFHRRKRPRQDEEEEEEDEPDPDPEPLKNSSSGKEKSSKSKSMEEIVEKTEPKNTATNDDAEATGKFKKKKSKKAKPSTATKKKKKKDVVRSYFGFSKSGKMDEASPDGSNEEVLVVEDDDHLQESEPKNKSSAVKFAYPSRADPEAVEVEEHHLQCLQEQEYVNDTIVDVYIKYIQTNHPEPLDKFHVFNSFFFKRLAQAVCDEDYHQSVSKLRKWTKGIDIYDKQYVLMPVHQKLHWSLVIVCFSGPKPGCHILHLDSMRTGHTSRPIYEVVRRYLAAEWIAHGGEAKDFKNVHERKIKVPQQKNEYDCGFFMLHFIEEFLLKAPASFSDSMITEMTKWFSFTKASELRAAIREVTDGMVSRKDDEAQASRPDPSPMAIDGEVKVKDPAAGKGTVDASTCEVTSGDLDTSGEDKQLQAKDQAGDRGGDDGVPVKGREDPDKLPSSEEQALGKCGSEGKVPGKSYDRRDLDERPGAGDRGGEPGKLVEKADDHPPAPATEEKLGDKAEDHPHLPAAGEKLGVKADDHPPAAEEKGEDHPPAKAPGGAGDHRPDSGGGEAEDHRPAKDLESEGKVLGQTEERLEQ